MKFKPANIPLVAVLMLGMLSCSKGRNRDEDEQEQTALELLNQKKFQEVVDALALICPEKVSGKVRCKQLLYQSYAGLGGFDIFKLKSIIDQLQASAEQQNLSAISNSSFLEPIPTLSDEQFQSIDSAIVVLKSIEHPSKTSDRDLNFQWASLSTYRLLVHLKSVVKNSEQYGSDKNRLSQRVSERKVIVGIERIIEDFFLIYINSKNSYPKLSQIFQRSLSLALKDPVLLSYQLKFDDDARSYSDFYRHFFLENGSFVLRAISILINRIDRDDIETAQDSLWSNLVDVIPEMEVLRVNDWFLLKAVIVVGVLTYVSDKDISIYLFSNSGFRRLVDAWGNALEGIVKEKNLDRVFYEFNDPQSTSNLIFHDQLNLISIDTDTGHPSHLEMWVTKEASHWIFNNFSFEMGRTYFGYNPELYKLYSGLIKFVGNIDGPYK